MTRSAGSRLGDRLRLDRVGRLAEEVLDDPQGELLLAHGERVEGALGAAQPDGEVVEGEPGEPLGQEERLELVEQLGLPAGQPGVGRRPCSSSPSSGGSMDLNDQQYCGTVLSTVFDEGEPCRSTANCPRPRPTT